MSPCSSWETGRDTLSICPQKKANRICSVHQWLLFYGYKRFYNPGQGNHQTGLGLIELKSVFVSWFGRVNINFKWNWISFGRKYLKCSEVSLQMFSKWTFEPGWSNNALINQLETKYVTRNRKNNNLLLLKWKAYYCTSLRPK